MILLTQVPLEQIDTASLRLYRRRCLNYIADYKARNSGDVVHVGLVVGKRADLEAAGFKFTILSQMGALGEYIHDAADLPAMLSLNTGGIETSYWSEAKQ